jgi:outer membrane protein assembly factor BamB
MDRPAGAGDERIVCFDEKTGRLLWEHRYAADYGGFTQGYDNGPRCTPTVHEGRVYTLGAVGHLYCFDARTGQVIWSKDLVRDHAAGMPTWGFAASPVIDGEKVIVHAGLVPGGSYVAYDRRRGREIWRGGDDPAGYGTPIVVEHAGTRQLIGWTPEHIVGLRMADGGLLWKYPYKVTYGVSIATPIFQESTMLVCGYWEGSKAIRLGPQPHQAELLWEENRYLRGIMDQPLYKDGFVYLLDKQHGIVGFELAKGEKLWTDNHRLTPRNRNPQVSMVWLADGDRQRGAGRAICLNASGELVLVHLSPQGLVEQSRAKIIGPTWAHPAYAGQCCYARDDRQIVCVRLTGDEASGVREGETGRQRDAETQRRPADDSEKARPRVIIETDAGGDPDDEQSLVRFLLYANDLDVEGIIANRPVARERENKNVERTGLGIVRRMLKAYEACYPKLVQHDRRYPPPGTLWERTVAGYNDVEDGVRLIIEAVDREDPRPLWFCNWGTDAGAAESCLKRALDQVLRQRGPEGYAKFKSRLRLASSDEFGDHTTKFEPPFPIWVDTFRPEIDRRRWYHRFSALTATAGGFDIERDVRTNHGPLGELYPTNTTHKQKEGDSPTFIYLIPNGLNEPEQPTWGGWAGRYGPMDGMAGKPYFWANQADTWRGTTHRENSLARWAEHLQNDFAARTDWCVSDFDSANHPPHVQLAGEKVRRAHPGQRISFDASPTSDPDGDKLSFQWLVYPEPTGYTGPIPAIEGDRVASLIVPAADKPTTLHVILTVTDSGKPPLSRYARAILDIGPQP